MCCVSNGPHQSVETSIMLFGVSITATKISILCLYYRLFPRLLFRRATIILGVTCVLWLLTIGTVFLLKCMPMATLGNKQHSCINFEKYFLAANITEIIFDFAILCLPLRAVSYLPFPLRQKIAVYMTFLVGGL